jgi:hypothetical protein
VKKLLDFLIPAIPESPMCGHMKQIMFRSLVHRRIL